MAMKVGTTARLHVPSHEYISLRELNTLGSSPEHMFPGQRHHAKTLSRKKHVKGMLTGDSLIFHAVRCVRPARLFLIDGYHRTLALRVGLASLPKGAKPVLITHLARNMDEAVFIYEQLNSLLAAKRFGDAFDSALRTCGLLDVVTSPQILKGGRATAAQLAAGKVGSIYTKEAAIDVMDGIAFVNRLQLAHPRFEIAGVLGVHIAAAQYCPDARHVERFIRDVNSTSFSPPSPTSAEKIVMHYRDILLAGHLTGGTGNKVAFAIGLSTFIQYLAAQKRKRLKAVPSSLTLAEFFLYLEKLA